MTSGIIEILIASTAVQTLVGMNEANTKFKVFPVVCPQKESEPFIIVTKMLTEPTQVKGEESLLDYCEYQVVGYSKVFRKTEEMGEAIRDALDNVAEDTQSAIFERIWLTEDRDGFDPLADLYAHVCVVRAEVRRTETT